MEFKEKIDQCIYDSLSYETKGFKFRRLTMKNLILMGDFDSWFTLKEGFEAPIQEDKWIEHQITKSEVNLKVTKLILDILSNNILYRLEKYKNANDLWMRLYEDPLRLEDKLREDQFEGKLNHNPQCQS